MVANKGRFLRFGQRLVPPGRESLWDDVAAATTRSFGGFVRGQFGIAALYGVVVGIIAFIFGVPFVALIAVVTAALQSIPYFGQLISWAPLFLTALVFAPTSLVPVTICLVVGPAGHPEHHLAPGAGLRGGHEPHPRARRGVRGRPGRGCHRRRLRGARRSRCS